MARSLLLPAFLSPLLNALVIYVTAIQSPPPPYFTFYYPVRCFIQVYILHYVPCCHFPYFIFDFHSNSAAGGSVATAVSLPTSQGPSVVPKTRVFYSISTSYSRHWQGGSSLWHSTLDVRVGTWVPASVLSPCGWDAFEQGSRRSGFDPWVREIPWRREWQPTPVFLPGEFHGQRSLVGCQVANKSDTTEPLSVSLLPQPLGSNAEWSEVELMQ